MNLESIKTNFIKRNIKSEVFYKEEDIINYIKELIKDAKTVGIGGSITIEQLGLYEIFKEEEKEIFWHWKVEPEKRNEILKKASSSNIYFSSSNAIVEDGRLVNIDGNGNRVSSMIFGPDKVVIIAGKNKIVPNIDAALKRIKEEACPLNARRLNRDTPCAITGKCNDCKGVNRMCNVTTIIEGHLPSVDIEVLLIDKDLGY